MVRMPVCFLAALMFVTAVPAAAQTPPDSLRTAQGVVRELYRLVCVEKGQPTPDWDRIRALFVPEAVVFMRVSREESQLFTLEGWIDDFVQFNESARVTERGFTEKIVRMDAIVFRNIANVFVLYEAAITDSPRPPTRGVDSIDLVYRDGRWWVASIVNDIITPEHPAPQRLGE